MCWLCHVVQYANPVTKLLVWCGALYSKYFEAYNRHTKRGSWKKVRIYNTSRIHREERFITTLRLKMSLLKRIRMQMTVVKNFYEERLLHCIQSHGKDRKSLDSIRAEMCAAV